MTQLTKLTIKKFRNVAPTTLEFRPGLNVILGKNAAGKTSLLRLLSTAVGVQEEALKDEVLEVSYHASGASLDFEHTITRSRVDEPALLQEPGRFEAGEFSSIQQKDLFIFKKDDKVLLNAEVLPNETVIERAGQRNRVVQGGLSQPFFSVGFAIAKTADKADATAFLESLLAARIISAGRMDESHTRFGKLLDSRLEVSGKAWRWSLRELPLSMFLMMATPLPDSTSATYSLGFLDRVARVLGYESAQARFDVERLSPEPNQHVVRLSNLRFFFKRPGEEISHDLLSYGQKRLLAFFAHADASSDVVIADELVNGLHHEWISACLEEIGDRQAFLTSQNPLLLDFLRFDSAEEVRRTFILCERENRENGAQLIWRNPTEEEAESFFAAYQTGIQRVSDILLTKGLW